MTGEPSPSRRLDALEARFAVADLAQRYALAVDARDVETFVGLWEPDGTYEFPEHGVVHRGHVAIRAALEQVIDRFAQTCHSPGHLVVMPAGEGRLQGWSTVFARVVTSDGTVSTITARYEDEFINTSDGWRFSRRVVN